MVLSPLCPNPDHSLRCFKSLRHILILNISKTIKDITTHLIYSESLRSEVFEGMVKNVQCEHRWSHRTPQANGPILAKRVAELPFAQLYHVKFKDTLSWAQTPSSMY